MPHVPEQHAQHDPLLVVSLAADDLIGAERDLATSLIATCAECATLHDDLLAIARAAAALPTAVRPRDFQLSPEQASHLRPRGWRRLVAPFASPRLAMTRQLGIGLTTLGIAGLLVSVLPSFPNNNSAAGASAAPEAAMQSTDDTKYGSSESGASPAASAAAPSDGAAAPSVTASRGLVTTGSDPSASAGPATVPFASALPDGTAASGDGTTGNASPQASDTDGLTAAPLPAQREALEQSATTEPGLPLILVASAILLAAGIALLVARRIARGITGG